MGRECPAPRDAHARARRVGQVLRDVLRIRTRLLQRPLLGMVEVALDLAA
jgi:hypothetical protein